MVPNRLKLNFTLPSENTKSPHLDLDGYPISQHQMKIGEAKKEADKVVLFSEKESSEMRYWGEQTKQEVDEFLKQARKKLSSKTSGLNKNELMDEVDRWEYEISQRIRFYFQNINERLRQLKLLNPPMSSADQEPFLQKILSFRRMTLASLEPLCGDLTALTELKNRLL